MAGWSAGSLPLPFAGTQIFDTADTYCSGPGEEHYVERLLAHVHTGNQAVHVCTKGGMVRVGTDSKSWRTGDTSYRGVAAAIAASFDALGGKRPIFLWQLHHTAGLADLDAALCAARDACTAGTVLNVGLCNARVADIKRAKRFVAVACVQNRFSLYHRAAEKNELPYCQRHGIPFMAYGALGGVAARDGRVGLSRDFPALAAMAAAKHTSPEALVLAWMRHKWPCIVHITGARTVAHMADARNAAAVRFTEDELAVIDALAPQGRAT